MMSQQSNSDESDGWLWPLWPFRTSDSYSVRFVQSVFLDPLIPGKTYIRRWQGSVNWEHEEIVFDREWYCPTRSDIQRLAHVAPEESPQNPSWHAIAARLGGRAVLIDVSAAEAIGMLVGGDKDPDSSDVSEKLDFFAAYADVEAELRILAWELNVTIEYFSRDASVTFPGMDPNSPAGVIARFGFQNQFDRLSNANASASKSFARLEFVPRSENPVPIESVECTALSYSECLLRIADWTTAFLMRFDPRIPAFGNEVSTLFGWDNWDDETARKTWTQLCEWLQSDALRQDLDRCRREMPGEFLRAAESLPIGIPQKKLDPDENEKFTAYFSPADWRLWLKDNGRACSETAWKNFKKGRKGEDHPLRGNRLVRFKISSLLEDKLPWP